MLFIAEVVAIKYFANIISTSRITAAIVLIFAMPLSLEFFILYSYCGITDVLDGVVARRTHTESKSGAFLDSIADIIFLVVTAIRLLPLLFEIVPRWGLIVSVGIAAIRISSYVVGAVKFHRFTALHIISNKIAGAALFLVPYMLQSVDADILTAVVCVLAGISALEELLCEIKSKSYNPDIRTIFEM